MREKELFKDISKKLKKITDNSVGWKNRLQGINLDNVKIREDLNKIPVTRKSNLIELQKDNAPYAGFNTKKPKGVCIHVCFTRTYL